MRYKVLMEVDAWWDVRLATLGILNPEYAARIMSSKWSNRPNDDIIYKSGISKEVFDSALKKHADDALRSSIRTAIAEFILDMIATDVKEQVTPQDDATYEFVLNTHGYDLDDDDCEAIFDSVSELVPLFHSYSKVRLSPEQLTPMVIKAQGYTVHVVYDLETWYQPHVSAIEQCRLPSHYIVCPDLMLDPDWASKLSKQDMQDLDGWTPTKVLEYFSTEFYPIRRIPIQWYSAILTTA
jgi:hypothetical protein